MLWSLTVFHVLEKIEKYIHAYVEERSAHLVQTRAGNLTKILLWYQFYWQWNSKQSRLCSWIWEGFRRHVAIAILPFEQHTVLERVIGCRCFYHLLKSLNNLLTEWLLPSLPMQTVHSKIHHKVSGQWNDLLPWLSFCDAFDTSSLKQTLTLQPI